MYTAQKAAPAPTAPAPPPDGGAGGGGTTSPGVATPPTFEPPKGMDPYQYQNTYQSGSSSGTQNQTGTSTGSSIGDQTNNNVYDPNSIALRNLGANLLNQVATTGQIQGFGGNNDQIFNALNRSFQRNIAPGMATQYGAGSPAIGSQQALMNEQLAAQLSRDQWTNFNNIFDDISNFAFTPTGQTAHNTQSQQSQQEQQATNTNTWQSNNTMEGALLSSLLTSLKGAGNII